MTPNYAITKYVMPWFTEFDRLRATDYNGRAVIFDRALALLSEPAIGTKNNKAYGFTKLKHIKQVCNTFQKENLSMADSTFERVKNIIVEQLGVDPGDVTMEASFRDDLEADSLDLVELIMAFEEEFGGDISDDEAQMIKSVGDAVNFLDGA